jgi:hypothetical protein
VEYYHAYPADRQEECDTTFVQHGGQLESPPPVGEHEGRLSGASVEEEPRGPFDHLPEPLDSVIGIIKHGPDFSLAEHHDVILYPKPFEDKDRAL